MKFAVGPQTRKLTGGWCCRYNRMDRGNANSPTVADEQYEATQLVLKLVHSRPFKQLTMAQTTGDGMDLTS